jgi:aminoacrylate hydrolase
VAGPHTLRRGDTVLSYAAEGTGPPVLLIQGVGVAGCGWRPQVDALASSFRAVTFDNRGIGGSTRGSTPLTIELMADDALAVADAASLDRFHLVGHSMGGLIAQAVAIRAKARLLSLALMCTFADGREGSKMSLGMMLRAIRMRVGTRPMRRRAMMDLIMPSGVVTAVNEAAWAARLGAAFGRDLADQEAIAMPQLKAMAKYDATPSLASLAGLPTLVLGGAHDRIARAPLCRALALAIPGARYIEYPDAAHALPIQCADAVNELLIAHLKESGVRNQESGIRNQQGRGTRNQEPEPSDS